MIIVAGASPGSAWRDGGRPLSRPWPRAAAIVGLLLLSLCSNAGADVFRPAYLELTQESAERYSVIWRVPALPDQRRLAASPRWPDRVSREEPVSAALLGSSWEERYSITASGGLTGEQITIEGVLGSATDVILRIQRLDGTTQLERLSPAAASFTITESPGASEIAWSYLVLGIEHILGGIDHLLFVLGLLLLVRELKRLVLTITAFTAAHSLTLAGATLGWISLPGPPVEAVIALSIVFVAAEIIYQQRGQASMTARAPWTVAFAFGLLHGLGFAGALEEVGLPATAVPMALLMFNVGVEIGQLLFVLACSLPMVLLARFAAGVLPTLRSGLAYGIGSIAAFWTIERIAAFTL
ncbi:MAG: HupE/UreJ family protein [Pseudomonadota bacterium]